MKAWKGSRLGPNLWEPYSDRLRGITIRMDHNIGIPIARQIFSVKFREISTGKEVLVGNSYFFDGQVGSKFYITQLTDNYFVIMLRPSLENDVYEYIVELIEEAQDQAICVKSGDSKDSLGLDVVYRFDFGDGTVTNWRPEPIASHVYDNPGTYNVRAQSSSVGIVSFWSDPLVIKAYDQPVIIQTPHILTGDEKVQLGLMTSYKISGKVQLDGSLEFRVNWGDGNVSDWTLYNVFSHVWQEEGDYELTCQSRLTMGYKQESAWSEPLLVKVLSEYLALEELNKAQYVVDTGINKTGTPSVSYSF